MQSYRINSKILRGDYVDENKIMLTMKKLKWSKI